MHSMDMVARHWVIQSRNSLEGYTSRVALLGSGAMGSRIAQNLLSANHQVVVYNNRTPDKVKPLLKNHAIAIESSTLSVGWTR